MEQHVSFYTQRSKNSRDSILLVLIVLAFILLLAYFFSDMFAPELALIILIGAGIFVVIDAYVSYMYGDKAVLASTNAQLADPIKHVYYINTAEGLAIAAGMPVPKLYVLPNKDINAFATGRDPKHASIAVTQGALDNLSRQELEGVIAHEMSHIGNYDIRFFMMVAVFVGLVAILSNILLRSTLHSGGGNKKGNGYIIVIALVLAVIAPIVSRLVQLSISRKREYMADATGVKLTRYPPGLAGALAKIQKMNSGKMAISDAVSHLFISDPKNTFMDNVFATHPPIEKRIAALRAM